FQAAQLRGHLLIQADEFIQLPRLHLTRRYACVHVILLCSIEQALRSYNTSLPAPGSRRARTATELDPTGAPHSATATFAMISFLVVLVLRTNLSLSGLLRL